MNKSEKDFNNFEEFKKYVDDNLNEALKEVDNGNYKPINNL